MASLTGSAQALWDEWFDVQYDIARCVDNAVEAKSKGKGDLFKAALYSGLIEHLAEQMRSCIELEQKKEQSHDVQDQG